LDWLVPVLHAALSRRLENAMTDWARFSNPVQDTLEEGPINLDGADDVELIEFGLMSQADMRKAAKIMFPGKKKAFTTVKFLSAYAEHTAAARGFRSLGNIQEAMKHEQRADVVYRYIPEYARW
jgi:hypothetical protein